jgi:nucleotide-binding universal stress UspA family protein
MNVIVFGYVLQRPEAEAALQRAIDEARHREAKLVVLHSARGGVNEDVEEVVAYRNAFEKLDEQLGNAGIEYELREFVKGNSVATDVLELAEETDAEMIVIGLRRRSPVGKLVLGSNAQDIMLNTSRPVLAIPAPDADAG